MVANTFIPGAPEEKATFIEADFTYLGEVSETGYNMIPVNPRPDITEIRGLKVILI